MINRKRLSKLIWLKLRRKSRQLVPKKKQVAKIQTLQQELWFDATWNTNYIVFTISACLIATFGLISNSSAVIIGAMLISPLMFPILLNLSNKCL